ncbi:hypothetical protein A6F68_00164 [Tsuneonella dongtanensis]|uniref:Uncharacterized protein n=1 Tax=Tsuneonella dongtanensis TaxID=692370 RepID=A0A1B2A966_9SPHN|nr:hypothetical protein [Tsuneonella dongtanensis]ANY18699.1 hypothetical protein A6F68_00164 [Tsuneonella dongtanensis]
MILRLFPAFALLAVPAVAQPVVSEQAPLSLQQASALRCSAAFALGSAIQGRGEKTDWPVLGTRGREFFVRASAQVMDETGRSRESVAASISEYARLLSDRSALDAAMPPCLLLLDASGL